MFRLMNCNIDYSDVFYSIDDILWNRQSVLHVKSEGRWGTKLNSKTQVLCYTHSVFYLVTRVSVHAVVSHNKVSLFVTPLIIVSTHHTCNKLRENGLFKLHDFKEVMSIGGTLGYGTSLGDSFLISEGNRAEWPGYFLQSLIRHLLPLVNSYPLHSLAF